MVCKQKLKHRVHQSGSEEVPQAAETEREKEREGARLHRSIQSGA